MLRAQIIHYYQQQRRTRAQMQQELNLCIHAHCRLARKLHMQPLDLEVSSSAYLASGSHSLWLTCAHTNFAFEATCTITGLCTVGTPAIAHFQVTIFQPQYMY